MQNPAAERQTDGARMAQRLQKQIDELKAGHQDLIAQLRSIHQAALQENATQTAGKIESLISQRQQSFQEAVREVEQQLQRLNRTTRQRAAGREERGRRARKAPDFELDSFEGRTVDLADYKGRVVVLEWLNTDCPFVKYHYDQANTMIDLANKYRDKGVVWFAVNSTNTTTTEANREFAKKHKLPYPILDDRSGKVGRLYGAMRTPHVFVIDREGNIVYSGAIDSAPLGRQQGEGGKVNYVDKALSELTSGGQVSMPTTPPYGCTVKYPG